MKEKQGLIHLYCGCLLYTSMALAVYHGMCTFDEAEIDPYQDLREPSCSH